MAFIGIKVPHEISRLLSGIAVPGTKENGSELHIAILCFENNLAISKIAEALQATYNVISNIKPFLVTINEVDCFSNHKNSEYTMVAKVKSNNLLKLNEKMKKEYDSHNIDYSKLFKNYVPHITLSRSDKEIDPFKIDKIEFSVSEIILWGGDHGDNRIFITFPLQGPKKQKEALLLQKIDMLCKFAKTPAQTYLTPSYERRVIGR
jgi:2'-5' RNA ligase